MKNLGRIDLAPRIPLKKVPAFIRRLHKKIADQKYIRFEIRVTFFDLFPEFRNSLEEVNDFVDNAWTEYTQNAVNGTLCDYNYELKPGRNKHEVVLQVTASPEELEWDEEIINPDDAKEQQRRDEKNGLHGSKVDEAN